MAAKLAAIEDEDGNFKEMARCCNDCCGKACADSTDFSQIALKDEDKWMLNRINDCIEYVDPAMDRYDMAMAGQRIYDLIWNEYCDWYIELVKPRLWGDDEEDKKVVRFALVMCLKNMLKLLHPFMPFITEEIWSYLPHGEGEKKYLISESWPKASLSYVYPEATKVLQITMDAVRAIRNIKAEKAVAPSVKIKATVLAEGEKADLLRKGESYLRNLGNITELTFAASKEDIPEDSVSAVIDGAEIYVPLDELVDYKEEFDRLTKEKARLEGEVKRSNGMLSNPNFVNKAPEAKVQSEKDKLVVYEEMLDKVIKQLEIVSQKVK